MYEMVQVRQILDKNGWYLTQPFSLLLPYVYVRTKDAAQIIFC